MENKLPPLRVDQRKWVCSAAKIWRFEIRAWAVGLDVGREFVDDSGTRHVPRESCSFRKQVCGERSSEWEQQAVWWIHVCRLQDTYVCVSWWWWWWGGDNKTSRGKQSIWLRNHCIFLLTNRADFFTPRSLLWLFPLTVVFKTTVQLQKIAR